MGRADLIGNSDRHLVPRFQPQGTVQQACGKPRRGPAPVQAKPRKPGFSSNKAGRK